MAGKRTVLIIACTAAVGFAGASGAPLCRAEGGPTQEAQQAAANAASRPVGAVKAISGNIITLTTDAGADVKIVAQESTRILRTPTVKDLKEATPMPLSDLQVGDRMLVRGKVADDKSVLASSIVVMKEADVAKHRAQEQEDWNKRGTGGLVNAIDAATGTITVATSAAPGAKTLTVRTSKNTTIRRYAPDSMHFDDAKIGSLAEIKAGDQVRARGNRNEDGSELMAEEIVSGSFRNVAGTISTIDAAANTITVMDLATKKPVTVKIAADSQLRKLPTMLAQRIAMRLKGEGAAGGAAAQGRPAAPGGERSGPEGPGGQRNGGAPDFQQILSRMTSPVTIADFIKGEAVMVVTTQGAPESGVTAITLLTGVEPILTASPKNGAMILSPWNLGGGGTGETE